MLEKSYYFFHENNSKKCCTNELCQTILIYEHNSTNPNDKMTIRYNVKGKAQLVNASRKGKQLFRNGTDEPISSLPKRPQSQQ